MLDRALPASLALAAVNHDRRAGDVTGRIWQEKGPCLARLGRRSRKVAWSSQSSYLPMLDWGVPTPVRPTVQTSMVLSEVERTLGHPLITATHGVDNWKVVVNR